MRAFIAAAVSAAVILTGASVVSAQATDRPGAPKPRSLDNPQRDPSAPETPEDKTSALVSAARKAKTSPKKSRISITDDVVRRSTGKLTILPEGKLLERTKAEPAPAATAAVIRADAKLAAARLEVDELEKELRRIEEAYYLEPDPKYREDVVRPRFEENRRQLDRAREILLAARSERQSLEPEPVSEPAAETAPPKNEED